ncbi:MAG: response regulator [Burkholderiaceae bacterium]
MSALANLTRNWRSLDRMGRAQGELAATILKDYMSVVLVACVVLAAFVLLFPSHYVRPAGTLVMVAILAAAAWWHRRYCQRAGAWRACGSYALFSWALCALYYGLSQQTALTGLMAAAFLPVLTLIRGVGAASLYAVTFLLLLLGGFVASRMGIDVPVYFVGAPLGVLVLVSVSLFAVILPLPRILEQLQGLLSSAQAELTERHRLEAELRESSERLQTYASVGSDWFWETDTEHRISRYIVSSSRAAQADIEVPRVIGRRRWELTAPRNADDAALWAEHRATVEAHKPFYTLEYPYRRSNGDVRWMSVSGKPVFDGAGNFTGYRGSSTDISWRKEKEEELRRITAAAEAANVAKSDFLATMSHEIRTPMNGIVGLTQLALETPVTREQREYLEGVRQSADSLLLIINDILDLSKIEARQMELESVDFDLAPLLDSVVRPQQIVASGKGLQLTLQMAPGLPARACGDPGRLRQVLLNLVGNAMKFTERGSITIEVAPLPGLPGMGAAQQHLGFRIVDTGVGIPEDKLGRLFVPFSQADSSTARRYGGTGLGLAISKQLVEMMGGQIGVHSTPGQGSVFHFSVVLDAARAPETLPAALAPLARPIRALRVLVVEDHPINQQLAQRMLEKAGHEVHLALSGEEGIAQWRSLKPDLILMDMQMPVMDGLQATRAIRAEELASGRTEHVPIIAMTANAFAEDRQMCLDAGMDGYLSKPVKPDVLNQAIADCVV